jgi:ankyrin repeat protein
MMISRLHTSLLSLAHQYYKDNLVAPVSEIPKINPIKDGKAPNIHTEILLILGPFPHNENSINHIQVFIPQLQAEVAKGGLKLRIIGDGKNPINYDDVLAVRGKIPPFTPAIILADGMIPMVRDRQYGMVHHVLVDAANAPSSSSKVVPTMELMEYLRRIENIGIINLFSCKDGYAAENIAANSELMANPAFQYLCVGGKNVTKRNSGVVAILNLVKYYAHCAINGELPSDVLRQIHHQLLTSSLCLRKVSTVTNKDGTQNPIIVHIPGLKTPRDPIHGRINAIKVETEATKEYEETIKASLRSFAGKNPNADYYNIALFQSIVRNDVKNIDSFREIMDLNEFMDLNGLESDGETPLYLACKDGISDMVEALLKYDFIDVNKSIKDGYTPLFIACYKDETYAVELLLNHHTIDVNKKSEGESPIVVACRRDSLESVILLLNHPNIFLDSESEKEVEKFIANTEQTKGIDKAKRLAEAYQAYLQRTEKPTCVVS